jgi:uncharacterized protein (UPF0261 family)
MYTSRTIAIIGTLDTKGDQIEYLKQRIESYGQRTTLIDVGVLGAVPLAPDISRESVARAAGSNLRDVIALHDHFLAMGKMAEGAYATVKRLCTKRALKGIVALGGSQGTALALEALKAAPLGMPKMLVTTLAYSQLITPDMVSGNDLMMIPWTAGLWGLNSMSRSALDTAAGAISGAATAYASRRAARKRVVGVTSLGSRVNRYMDRLKPALEQKGYEVAVFHVTGMSGRLFERAIADGSIACSLDLSVGVELLNSVTGGACAAGPDRLEAAGKMAIPQIVSPGAIEAFHWGKDRPFPAQYEDRPRHQHNSLILTVGSRTEEIAATARLMADKLNRAQGPVGVVLPMRGMLGPEDTGVAPAALQDVPGFVHFIKRLQSITIPGMLAFRDAFLKCIHRDIKVVTLNAGFNDPLYVKSVLALFDEQMAG